MRLAWLYFGVPLPGTFTAKRAMATAHDAFISYSHESDGALGPARCWVACMRPFSVTALSAINLVPVRGLRILHPPAIGGTDR